MDTNEKQEILKKAGELLSDHLKEGRTYYRPQIRTEHGTQGGTIFFTENGVTNRWPFNNDEAFQNEIEELDNPIRSLGSDLDRFYQELPPFTKYEYVFRKGEPVVFKVYSAADLIEDYKAILIKEEIEEDEHNGSFKSFEAIIRFEMQADELGMFVDATTVHEKRSWSRDFVRETIVMECLYAALDKKLEALYIKLENENFTFESKPAFPELGFGELKHESIALQAAYEESKKALLEAQQMRHEIYSSFGKMDERKIYLNVGGFRSNNWPENSTTHTSEIMRVIYTEQTTVLICDGLSDIYLGKKDLQQYNGIGVEFYLEFAGHVPFETVKDHYCLALLNSVTQIAINHGDIKKFMENHTYTTIQFNEENVETWCVRGNDSNNKLKTFFRDEQYKGDKFGTLLGMPSKTIPASMKLNKEEVLLVNVKPFSKEWLTASKLNSKDAEVQTKTRLKMMEQFNKTGEGNTVPVTYNESGESGHPEKSNIVQTPLIPKNLL